MLKLPEPSTRPEVKLFKLNPCKLVIHAIKRRDVHGKRERAAEEPSNRLEVDEHFEVTSA